MRNETREDIANYLLNHSFLIGNFEATRERYFQLLSNEEELQSIFRPLGYTIIINRNLRVAQLINLKETGRVELRKYESILLLILRLLYVEKRESLYVSEQMVTVTVSELETEYNKLNLPRKLDRKTLEDALRLFKRYNLAQALERLDKPEARIQILPSVMLAMPEQAITAAYEQTKDLLMQYQKSSAMDSEEDE